MRSLFLILAAMTLPAVACSSGGGEDEPAFAVAQSAPAAPAIAPRALERSFGSAAPAVAPAAPAVAAVAVAPAPASAFAAVAEDVSSSLEKDVASLATQQRIIVRTVDIAVVLADIAESMDRITELAQNMGGWVVSSNRFKKHRGFISIRVPADQLDDALLSLRNMAVEVESEVSSSEDVTDEYVDIQARLTNLRATETALLKLFERAQTVEEALMVQDSLTRVQGDIERFQGRIKFLEQTAAFSLISVTLKLDSAKMAVDAGPDQITGVRERVRFRASFKPPEGIEDFTFTWDFGDGSQPVTSDRTAPTEDGDTRVTATITHAYGDERDSPYFAEVEITGTGDAGLAEGEDIIEVNVSERPVIEVFAGERVTVKEDEEIELSGSFTRPEGVANVRFRWDFGDGAPPVEGDLQAGLTNAVARHVYGDHRPFPFVATLTVTAESEAGSIEAFSSVDVRVTESEGWVLAGWSAEDQGKTAVRTLSAVGQWLLSALIWIAIFSPVWAAVGYGAILGRRRLRK